MWGTGGVYTILGTNESVNGALLKFYNVHICCLALTVDFLTTQWSFTFAPYIYPNCVKAGTGILGEEVVSSRKSPSGPGEVLPNQAVTSDHGSVPWSAEDLAKEGLQETFTTAFRCSSSVKKLR